MLLPVVPGLIQGACELVTIIVGVLGHRTALSRKADAALEHSV